MTMVSAYPLLHSCKLLGMQQHVSTVYESGCPSSSPALYAVMRRLRLSSMRVRVCPGTL